MKMKGHLEKLLFMCYGGIYENYAGMKIGRKGLAADDVGCIEEGTN